MIRPIRTTIALLAGMVLLVMMPASVVFAEVEESEIRERIELLDDDAFAVRQRAAAELLAIGLPAVALLREAEKSEAPERRARAAELLAMIMNRRIAAEFTTLGAMADDAIDVERGMWAMALILDPEVSRASIDARLDAIAAAVRKKCGEGVDPAALPTREIAAVMIGVLRDDIGLKGDHVNYDHPDNSSVHRVLEQKDGLPIVLSEIAVAVGRRLGVPMVGIPVPGRYMFKFVAAEQEDELLIDPFGGWVEAGGVGGFDAPRWLASPPRATLVRMLNNLEADLLVLGDGRRAREVVGYRALMEGPGVAEM